jgi:hypothetical protein
MDYQEIVKFYEANLEILQILKSLKKRGDDFYKDFKVTYLKPELSNSFFEMNKAEICNNLQEYFFQLQKQIETLLDYTIKELIKFDKVKKDSKSFEIQDKDGNPIKLGTWLFNIENKDDYNSKIEAIDFKKIPISTKLNIFYVYVISKNPNEKITSSETQKFKRNLGEFNFFTTNTMIAFRNKMSHGNVELTESQIKLIEDAEKKNEENLYFFFVNYQKLLYSIVSKVNSLVTNPTFLI